MFNFILNLLERHQHHSRGWFCTPAERDGAKVRRSVIKGGQQLSAMWSITPAGALCDCKRIQCYPSLNAVQPVFTWHAVQWVTLWWRWCRRGQKDRWDDSRDTCRWLGRFTVTGAGLDIPCPRLNHLLVLLLQFLILDHILDSLFFLTDTHIWTVGSLSGFAPRVKHFLSVVYWWALTSWEWTVISAVPHQQMHEMWKQMVK